MSMMIRITKIGGPDSGRHNQFTEGFCVEGLLEESCAPKVGRNLFIWRTKTQGVVKPGYFHTSPLTALNLDESGAGTVTTESGSVYKLERLDVE